MFSDQLLALETSKSKYKLGQVVEFRSVIGTIDEVKVDNLGNIYYYVYAGESLYIKYEHNIIRVLTDVEELKWRVLN